MRFKEYTHHDQEGVGWREVCVDTCSQGEGEQENVLLSLLLFCIQ